MPATQAHLRDYLLHADERSVSRFYPRHTAEALSTDHHTILALLTDAMLGGDVVMHWELQCPICNAQSELDSLDPVMGKAHCSECQSSFHAHLDDEVHVTFSVHPGVRRLSAGANDPQYRLKIATEVPPTTGHDMLTIQRFREWAQDQLLPPGESLDVSYMAIWFSDLSGSTALYARRGDPQAYQLVRDHFDVLFSTVDETGGAVVKTIGDSVMAVYTDAVAALKGAAMSHQRLARFNNERNLSTEDSLMLKIGLHCGPSIVVTLNDRLDYFGQTINLAARIAGVAGAGEVAISQAVFDEPGIQELLVHYQVEAMKTAVKGIDDEVIINRLRLLDGSD